MYNEKKVIVIIGAAGKGTRIGGSLPKQFQTIDSGRRTMLQKTVDVFDKRKAGLDQQCSRLDAERVNARQDG